MEKLHVVRFQSKIMEKPTWQAEVATASYNRLPELAFALKSHSLADFSSQTEKKINNLEADNE